MSATCANTAPANVQHAADAMLLDQVIAGTHAELLEPGLAVQIEAAFHRHHGDAAMAAKVDLAIQAYERAALEAAEGI